MTKILILIFTVLLALNINATDTQQGEESSTTGVNGVISGKILIGLTDHYGPKYKSSVIETEVYFKIIELSQDTLSLIINYNDYSLELFYDEYHNHAKFTLLQEGRELPIFDDTQKKQFNSIMASLKFNAIRILPKPYARIKSLVAIFKLLNHLTEDPYHKPIHNIDHSNPHDNSLPDTHTNFNVWSPFATMICDSVGHSRDAFYWYYDGETRKHQYKNVTVGDPFTDCLGSTSTRCDMNCTTVEWPDRLGGDWEWCSVHPRYTQESLNHDVCVEDYGEESRGCQDALILATPGMLFAPNCTTLPHNLHLGDQTISIN